MIEVEVEDASWTAALPDVEALVETAARSALLPAHPGESRDPGDASDLIHTAETDGRPGMGPGFPRDGRGLMILLTDDAAVRDLNARFLGKDAATNVLSFPAAPSAAPHLGDIALAYGVCAREAAEQRKPLAHHLQHLVVHGVLHLLGFDHLDDGEAEDMEARERVILAALGVRDPYAAPHAATLES